MAPRAGADRHFTIYGVLNPGADSQAVMVFPIEDDLRTLPNESPDIEVTSTELASGSRVVWDDSIRSTPDGAVYVYWSRFRAQHDRSYRLEVRSTISDEAAEVTVRVPPEAEIVDDDPVDGLFVTQNVRVTAPIERLNFLNVQYVIKARLPRAGAAFPILLPDREDVDIEPPEFDTLTVQTLFVPIEYSHLAQESAAGWTIPVNLSDDFREIRRRVTRRGRPDPSFGIQLQAIEVTMVAANAEWTVPGGQFDPEILIQPGTMTNVQGGFGFLGAGYRLEHSYTLSDEMKVRLGFRLPTS